MKNKYKNIIIVSLFVIASISIFLMYKSLNNKNIKLDEVKLKEIVKSQNSMFAIMLEQQDGSYLASDSNTWPTEGYTYNSTKSGCVDNDGNKVEGALSYNSSTNIAELTTSSSLKCYLYFDLDNTTLSLQTDTGTTGLSTGDVVTISKSDIPNQDFYVVSTNASETVLLAKYNLYVGRIYSTSTSSYTEIQSTDTGYGLQSSTAKGWVDGDSQYIGVVPFAGSSTSNGYWYDSANSTIYSKYGTSYNTSNIYDTDYVTAPNWTIAFNNNAGNANYSIAYYVEEYVDRLGINGTGRLLTYTEEQTLASSNNSVVFNNQSYWLGSAGSRNSVWFVYSDGFVNYNRFALDNYDGVRPVIVISTSSIQTS